MTKREKIIEILRGYGIDLIDQPWLEEKRWQKPGTIVLKEHCCVPDIRQIVRLADSEPYNGDPNIRSYTGKCPIEIHDIRYHFEWQWGYIRVTLKKEA